MIVVDSNVVAYLYLPGEFTAAAEKLLRREPEWAAPLLWRSELRNILALYVRQRLLTFERAFEIQREAEALLADNEYDVDSFEVLELARDSGCTAYDCEFVSLAKRLEVKLITGDAKLRSAFPNFTAPLSMR
jgi:predicted nucleic acid-binding protein